MLKIYSIYLAWLRTRRLAAVLPGPVGKIPNAFGGLGSRRLPEPSQDACRQQAGVSLAQPVARGGCRTRTAGPCHGGRDPSQGQGALGAPRCCKGKEAEGTGSSAGGARPSAELSRRS